MIEIKRVLLPTDFSEFSGEAVAYACTLVDKFDAELHVLHVLEMHRGAAPEFVMGLALTPEVKETREQAEEALSKVLPAEWAAGKRVHQATDDGVPASAIVRYAKQHHVDLIVMGTHGRTGLAHAMLGSVAEKVSRKAPCPVLSVRPESHRFEDD